MYNKILEDIKSTYYQHDAEPLREILASWVMLKDL